MTNYTSLMLKAVPEGHSIRRLTTAGFFPMSSWRNSCGLVCRRSSNWATSGLYRGCPGIELAQRILEATRRDYVFSSPSPVVFKTTEYWAGYYLAYFNGLRGCGFKTSSFGFLYRRSSRYTRFIMRWTSLISSMIS